MPGKVVEERRGNKGTVATGGINRARGQKRVWSHRSCFHKGKFQQSIPRSEGTHTLAPGVSSCSWRNLYGGGDRGFGLTRELYINEWPLETFKTKATFFVTNLTKGVQIMVEGRVKARNRFNPSSHWGGG